MTDTIPGSALAPLTRTSAPDGTGVAAYDLGGRGPDLLLVHATGFCAQVLRPLGAALAPAYHCWALDLRAHGASDRPGDGDFAWSGFAEDVLAVVDELGLERPHAFGHSCGGASVLLAEQARPGCFASLACFEPVVLPLVPAPGVQRDNPLSAGALRRRTSFASAEEARANFAAKPSFARMSPAAVSLYVAGAFEAVPVAEGGDGSTVRLRCRPEDEAEIYAHGSAHDAFAHLGEVACPVALACGADTDSFGPDALGAIAAALPRATVEVLADMGHFGPMERPELIATWIRRRLG